MRTNPTPLALATCALPVLLAGCVKLGSPPPASLLTITPAKSVAAGTTRSVSAGQAVTIMAPSVPASLATTRVPVQADDTNIAYLKNAQWVDLPAKIFQQLLAETVSAKTGRVVLDARQFTFDPGVRVTGELIRFGLDARTMEAVVIYEAAKAVDGGARVEERRFEARVPVTAADTASFSPAINQAANTVADSFADWIGG